jgi:tRNA pseudouridine38-40 synthase
MIASPEGSAAPRAKSMHWKLTISYDGTHFHGWQVQPGLATVQQTLTACLERLTGETLRLQASGRTDAGVHALAQVVSFSMDTALPGPNLQLALNQLLPASIRVLAAEVVARSFHARYSATAKTYEYRIFERRLRCEPGHENICPPFLAPYAWDCRWALDLAAMQKAAASVAGTHDFSSFAASDPDRASRLAEAHEGTAANSNVRTIIASEWERTPSALIYRVRGSGFLQHMVRNLAGTFVDVGRGAIPADALPRILAARNRSASGPTAPARGLFLLSVQYAQALAPDAEERAMNASAPAMKEQPL